MTDQTKAIRDMPHEQCRSAHTHLPHIWLRRPVSGFSTRRVQCCGVPVTEE